MTNDAFEAAVQPLLDTSGHAVVQGGAGSGKTTLALRKARKAIQGGLTHPHSKVLFMSFANATLERVIESATGELDERSLEKLQADTYHGFAWSIIRSHGYLLGAPRPALILSPGEENALQAEAADGARASHVELRQLFDKTGATSFAVMADLAREVFERNPTLLNAYSSAYPLILLDEFQDTTDDQWDLIKLLGQHSQLVALGDRNQRIYGYLPRSSPYRFEQFQAELSPVFVDLSAWNWRSPESSLVQFGKDVLAGAVQPPYESVKLVGAGYPPLLTLKSQVLAALKRQGTRTPRGSIAILTSTNALAARAYDYLSSAQDEPAFPALHLDIYSGREEAYAALTFVGALLGLEGNRPQEASMACVALARYLRSRSSKASKTAFKEATRLTIYSEKLREGSRPSVNVVRAVEALVERITERARTGHPYADYLATLTALSASKDANLVRIAKDARTLSLLTPESDVAAVLAEGWRREHRYADADNVVRNAVLAYQLTRSKQGSRDLVVMNMHRGKGREYDEVVVYEERYEPFVRSGATTADFVNARHALNVAVTRARTRATIVTPANFPSVLLFSV